jgi:WD40 repeat protein
MKGTVKKSMRLPLALLWGFILSGCYMINTPPVPNPAGFHYIDGYYDAGGVFHSGDSPFQGPITGMASDGDMVVAVSEDGTIAYSEDCIIWRVAEAGPPDISFSCLTWGEGVFFAGGEGGQAAWSADGIHWNRGVIGPMSPTDIHGVAAGKIAGKSVFVAAGKNGRIAWSEGGPQSGWAMSTLTPFGTEGDSSETVRAVAFGTVKTGNVFVAVGDDGKIAFMDDLTGKWYGGRTGISRDFNGVAFGGGRFVALGETGMIKFSSVPKSYSWAPGDGSIFGVRPLLGIAYDPLVKQFVAYGADAVVGISEYGDSWTAATFRSLFPEPEEISAVACTARRIVFGGSNGTIVYSN